MASVVAYLDMNHLIELAKQRAQGRTGLLDRLMALRAAGAVFPISAAHLSEIAAISKERQRKDLAAVVRPLSGGWVLRPLFEVMYDEVRERVATRYGAAPVPAPASVRVLARGFFRALGDYALDFSAHYVDPVRAAALEADVHAAMNDEALLDLLVQGYFAKLATGGAEHERIRQGIAADRAAFAGRSQEDVANQYVLGLNRRFIALVFQALAELGISETRWRADPPVKFWTPEYMSSLPTIDVWSRLHVYLYFNPNVAVKVNHVYDFAHITTALPYADVLVLDKEMAHTLTSHGMDAQYDTAVFRSLEESVEHLEARA